MYAKIAVVLIVALVGVAYAANSTCNPLSKASVSNDPTFSAYIQLDSSNSYIPLKYVGHSSGYDRPVRGVSRGKAEITTECAEINASLVVDETKKFYSLQWMTFSNGKSKQSCVLSSPVVGENGVKSYSCKNADEKSIATLVIERLNITDEGICQMIPTKLCKYTWVEGSQN